MESYDKFKELVNICLQKYPSLINKPMIILDVINAENSCNFPENFVYLYFEEIYPEILEMA